ncbi:hypothetical protein V6N13_123666 [Hibiscus sabdariffa]|uniref:Uncharacterized protein n=1 Tax=Hibiscus sabdariffa TaxID=183260 RepID=A0ABR2QU63_9ROSI
MDFCIRSTFPHFPNPFEIPSPNSRSISSQSPPPAPSRQTLPLLNLPSATFSSPGVSSSSFIFPPHMDQNLKEAAEAGNTSLLYEIIERDGNVLRCFDMVEFIETPLHIAAEKGCTRFAMELAKLKHPS